MAEQEIDQGKVVLPETLHSFANSISELDRNILKLLVERADIVRKLEKFKRSKQMPVIRPAVETQRMEEYEQFAKEFGLCPHFVKSLFFIIMAESSRVQFTQREECFPLSFWGRDVHEELTEF